MGLSPHFLLEILWLSSCLKVSFCQDGMSLHRAFSSTQSGKTRAPDGKVCPSLPMIMMTYGNFLLYMHLWSVFWFWLMWWGETWQLYNINKHCQRHNGPRHWVHWQYSTLLGKTSIAKLRFLSDIDQIRGWGGVGGLTVPKFFSPFSRSAFLVYFFQVIDLPRQSNDRTWVGKNFFCNYGFCACCTWPSFQAGSPFLTRGWGQLAPSD